MSKKRKKDEKYVPKPYESSNPKNDTFGAIYFSMLQSVAWKELKKGEQRLYLCMKQELHNSKNKPIKSDLLCFSFNLSMYSTKYNLGKNKRQFIKEKDSLIEKGFITCEDGGANTHTNAIYRFSDQWQRYPNIKLDRSKISISLNNKLNRQNAGGTGENNGT